MTEDVLIWGFGGSVICLVYAGFAVLMLHTQLISAKCGSCCGILVLLFCILPTFFGGIPMNAVVWAFITMAWCKQPVGVCCAFPCFVLFGLMLSLTVMVGGKAGRYVLLENTPPVEGISVCDWSAWRDTPGGVYFRDGTLAHAGNAAAFAHSGNVTHCIYHMPQKNSHRPGWWDSCEVGVRPIFACDSRWADCQAEAPCAWAVRLGGEPEQPDCRSGGLCGVPAKDSLQSILEPGAVCWGGDATIGMSAEEGCWRGVEELQEVLKQDAAMNGVTFDAEAPLIMLESPAQVVEDLQGSLYQYWIYAFCYVPLTILLGVLTVALVGDPWTLV